MPEYTYIFADLLTDNINLELPLYGTWFNHELNKPGNMTFTFSLDSEGFDNKDVLEGTIPGRTSIYVDRDGSLIWGGIVWSRTYQSQAKNLSYTAQTFESFLNKQYIEENLLFAGDDQRNILIDLINHMQTKEGANIGLLVPEKFTPATEGFQKAIQRVVSFSKHQVWTYGRAVEYMIEFADGFDYSIDVRYGTGRVPQKVVRVNNVLGAPIGATGNELVFDYPGSIKNYWFPENASRAAVSTIGVGAGDDDGKLLTKVVQEDLLVQGYPDLQETYTNTDVSRLGTLEDQTKLASELNRVPISVPTFQLSPGVGPKVGSYQLGDFARFDIEDPRFPDGKTFNTRVVGYEIRPPRSGEQEDVKLIIPGEEDVDA